MKVIKEGVKRGARLGRFECRSCDSVVEAKVCEAYRQDSSYQGDFLHFHCPVCEHPNGIELNKFLKNLTTLG